VILAADQADPQERFAPPAPDVRFVLPAGNSGGSLARRALAGNAEV